MKNRVVIAASLLAAFALVSAQAQALKPEDSTFSLSVSPGLRVPVGQNAEYFTLGGGADLKGEYRLPGMPILRIAGGLGYDLAPIKADTTISLLTVGAGVGIGGEVIPNLVLGAAVQGGYYYGFLNDSAAASELAGAETGGGNPFVAGSISATWMLSRTLGLGLSVGYRHLFGLSGDLRVLTGVSYHFQPLAARLRQELQQKAEPLHGLDLSDIELQAMFPVFYKYYDDHPIGSATLKNGESRDLEMVKVTVFVPQFMDSPKQCKCTERLKPGESAEVTLYGLFSDRVLGISEDTKVSAQLTVEATMGGRSYRNEFVETLRVNDRNAMTWDDDRKAAAFVTLKDPMVMRFAKNVVSTTKGRAARTLNGNLLTGLGVFQAMSLYGMSYAVDPTSSHKDMTRDTTTVDYIQFPRQTLTFRAGDCDDLSLLYSSLLESIGIETALITVPGHIFMAFSLDIDPAEVEKQFAQPRSLIIKGGKTWLPVEVTEASGSFLKAWDSGAQQWREFSIIGKAAFIPVREAWQSFEPVGLPGEAENVVLPDARQLAEKYQQEVSRFVDRELNPQVAALKAEIARTRGNHKAANRLGILYARYGQNERATQQFQAILGQKEYVPALINMGNLALLNGDSPRALEFFQRASRQEPGNEVALLGMARVNHEMENYGSSKAAYTKLKAVDPDLAARFSYLDLQGEEATRAAEASRAKEVMVWDEE